MNKVTIKTNEFNLKGDLIKVGERLSFKAKNRENKDVNIDDVEGLKILSIFPDINTRVCDLQTHRISQLASEAPHIHFISVTKDPVEITNEWCARNLINIDIWSDAEYGEFGDKTNALIPAINKLARGFIVLDKDNVIINMHFVEEVSSMPNFELIEKYI